MGRSGGSWPVVARAALEMLAPQISSACLIPGQVDLLDNPLSEIVVLFVRNEPSHRVAVIRPQMLQCECDSRSPILMTEHPASLAS
jgi:hypothetical protein